MEKNQVEMLDEIEQDIVVNNEPKKELKEYEKLLKAEQERKDTEKAINLVKMGCFDQKQEPKFSYEGLENIHLDKKYKGVYLLYKNVETSQLVFVCPLVEDNKGDADERKDLAPYAYDVLYTETMDEDTYKEVCKAAKNNLNSVSKVLYKTSFVLYFILIALTLFELIVNFISSLAADKDVFSAICVSLYSSGVFVAGLTVATPVLLFTRIKYLKDKESK